MLGSETFGASTGEDFVSAGITTFARGSSAGAGALDSETFGVAGATALDVIDDGVPVDAAVAAGAAITGLAALTEAAAGDGVVVEATMSLLVEAAEPLRRLVAATAGDLVAGATGVTVAAARGARDDARAVDASLERDSAVGVDGTAGVAAVAIGAGGVTAAAAADVVAVPGETLVSPDVLALLPVNGALDEDGVDVAPAVEAAVVPTAPFWPLAAWVPEGIMWSGSNITKAPAPIAATAMIIAVPNADDERGADAVDVEPPIR